MDSLARLATSFVAISIAWLSLACHEHGSAAVSEVTDIDVSFDLGSFAEGQEGEFSVIATRADGSTYDASASFQWSSSDEQVVQMDGPVATAIGPGTATVSAFDPVSELGGAVEVIVSEAVLESIELDPNHAQIAAGTERLLTATGIYTDSNTTPDLGRLIWDSSDAGTAAVDEGVVTGVSSGMASISVMDAETGVGASMTVEVTDTTLLSIEISPPNPSIPLGMDLRLVATGTFSDQTTQDVSSIVAWSSSDPAVVSVSQAPGEEGEATAHTLGMSTVTVTHSGTGVVQSTSVTVVPARLVTLEVSPSLSSIALGTDQQFTAVGTFSDQSTRDMTAELGWSSTVEAVVTLSNAPGTEGLASSVSLGESHVTATDPVTSVSASTSLTVSNSELQSISITPVTPTVADGGALQLTATGTFTDATTQDLTSQVTWASTATAAVTISNALGSEGLATSVGSGTAVVSAIEPETATTATTSFIVTPAELVSITLDPTTLAASLGTGHQYTATGTFSDLSTQDLTDAVTWSSTSVGVATVSNAAGTEGWVTAFGVGGTTIVGTDPVTSFSGSVPLTVTPAVLVAIEVTPPASLLAAGSDQALTATGIYSDATTADLTDGVTWTSSNPGSASVSNAVGFEGVVTAVSPGQTIVTATDPGSLLAGASNVTVTAGTLVSIGVSPAITSIALGTGRQFVATGTFSDASTFAMTDSVTWSSSAVGTATISNAEGSEGLATSAGVGAAMVTATDPATLVSGASALTVTAAVLTAVQVTPTEPTVALGDDQQFVATGTYSDASTQDLTDSVTWSCANLTAASISNALGSEGLASTLDTGDCLITATDPTSLLEGTATLTVTSAVLESVAVTPSLPSAALGTAQQFAAIGTYSDSSTQVITDSVTWSCDNSLAATISNALGSEGLATTAGAGVGVVTATDSSTLLQGGTTPTVTPATLVQVAVTPATPSLALGTDQQLTATGIFSDATTQDLTASVSWSSSVPATATISNAPGLEGVASSVSAGLAVVTATDPISSISGTANLTVTPATLVSLAVTPVLPSIALGSDQQCNATGTYSDGTTQDLTDSVTWSSENVLAATISNAPGTEGLASSVASGLAVITATEPMSSLMGATTLTVTPAVLLLVAVTPPSPSIALGSGQQLSATGVYSDASTQDLTSVVTWSSSSVATATISNGAGTEGLATSVGVGLTTITATEPSSLISGTSALTITAATLISLAVTPVLPGIALGTGQQLTATGTYSDASTQDLTDVVSWSAATPSVATISNASSTEGLVASVSPGTCVLTATHPGTLLAAATTLTVTPAVLVSITVTPHSVTLLPLATRQYTAMAVYSDATTQDLTDQVTWVSSFTLAAVISNAPGSKGELTAVLAGVSTISAVHVPTAVVGTTLVTVL